jgi:hypothetical protein
LETPGFDYIMNAPERVDVGQTDGLALAKRWRLAPDIFYRKDLVRRLVKYASSAARNSGCRIEERERPAGAYISNLFYKKYAAIISHANAMLLNIRTCRSS